MKTVFGPVPSRRLGRSLGIDLIPLKTCNYQCIYCQLGKTTYFTNERKSYFPPKDILREVEEAIQKNEGAIDYITFVGSGEPTLCEDLGDLIKGIKLFTEIPICVITNGGLLYKPEIKEELMHADVVLPSLDAGNEKTFIRINRPHPSIHYEQMLQGLVDFNQDFSGEFWIELMIIKNINDSREELEAIKQQLDRIRPVRIDINVPIRPPAEDFVEVPDKSVMSLLNEIFGEYHDINFPEMGHFGSFSENFEEEVLNIIQRHPMRQEQIIETFSTEKLPQEEILARLIKLLDEKRAEKKTYHEKIFWKAVLPK